MGNCVHCGLDCTALHDELARIFGGEVYHFMDGCNTLKVGELDIWHEECEHGISWYFDSVTNHNGFDHISLRLGAFGGKVDGPVAPHEDAIRSILKYSKPYDALDHAIFEGEYDG